MTGDQLELFFNSNRSGNSNLWVSKRDSVNQPWGDPDPVAGTGINTSSNETAPEISTDGLSALLLQQPRRRQGTQDIYLTERDDRDAPWDPPELVPELNSSAGDYSPVEDEAAGDLLLLHPRRRRPGSVRRHPRQR